MNRDLSAVAKQMIGPSGRRFARQLIDAGLFIGSRLPTHTLRVLALRLSGAKIGRDVALGRGVRVLDPWRLSIGEHTIIGTRVCLDARGGLVIGTNCNLSDDAAIWTAEHDIQSPDFAMIVGSVAIGDRVWLCFRSIVLPGVSIGEGSVVASSSVVSRDVSPFTLVGGVPARKIGERSRKLYYQLGRRNVTVAHLNRTREEIPRSDSDE